MFLFDLARRAQPVERSGDGRRRIRNEAALVLGQRKLFQRLVPGLMHVLIFWGFLVLLPTILIAGISAVDRHATLPWLGHQGWFIALEDLVALLVLAGVAIALVIRKLVRPARFEGSHLREAYVILALIAGVVLTLLGWHAARIAAGYDEWPARWSFLSNALAQAMPSSVALERVLVWVHLAFVFVFLAYVPRSKHLHIATAAVNVWFGRTQTRGRLEPLRFDVPEEQIRFGTGTVLDLTWKQVLDAFTCTECGRCQDACPAHATGKLLSPKLVIMGERDQLLAEGSRAAHEPIGGHGVPEEMIWDCVTCGACVDACPVSIEHVDHIVDLRRQLTMVDARFPAEAESMLRDIERCSNPWGKAQTERAAWAVKLGVHVLEPGEEAPEYLYWAGCAASFDERAQASAEATVGLLRSAGVDFAILGAREACTGDPARRIGNEYLFQAQAELNVATLNDAGVKKIVTGCPHCFNTLAHEYPDFGGNYEVLHHTELLARLVREGRLAPVRDGARITYHDSCYLARHNDVLSAPRELVAAVGEPVEMTRRERKTFCCGAGGAHMWLDERGAGINEERVREAAGTGADTLAVACPFCAIMLDDGVRTGGTQLRVVDVSTLLSESIRCFETSPPLA